MRDGGRMTGLGVLALGAWALAYPVWDSGERGAAIVIGIIGAIAALAEWRSIRKRRGSTPR